MFKKTYFDEIWFCKEFYIGGVDILSQDNRQFVKEVDINLSGYIKTFPHKYIKGAKLYRLFINNRSFKVAIADIATDVRIIAYLSYYSFMQSIKANDDKSRQTNERNLYAFAASVSKEQNSDNIIYVYNKDNSVRLKIEQIDNCVKAQRQIFWTNPDATIDIPTDLVKNPYEFLGWYENDGGVSIYDTVEQALKSANIDISRNDV